MSDEKKITKKYISDQYFGDVLYKIKSVEMLKAGKKLFEDMILINDLKEKIKEKEEALYSGKRGFFALYTERMDPNQLGLFASSLDGRLKFLKKELGIIDRNKNQIVDEMIKLQGDLVDIDKAYTAASLLYRKNPSTENSSLVNDLRKQATTIRDETSKRMKEIEEELEDLGIELTEEDFKAAE